MKMVSGLEQNNALAAKMVPQSRLIKGDSERNIGWRISFSSGDGTEQNIEDSDSIISQRQKHAKLRNNTLRSCISNQTVNGVRRDIQELCASLEGLQIEGCRMTHMHSVSCIISAGEVEHLTMKAYCLVLYRCCVLQ